MLTRLRIQNFKSWADTGEISLAPLTGLFGVNSSGKTAILQLLLLLKQTIESTHLSRTLHLGDDSTLVNLGTMYDVFHKHQISSKLQVDFSWTLTTPLRIPDMRKGPGSTLFDIKAMDFHTSIIGDEWALPIVEEFNYQFQSGDRSYQFGMREEERNQYIFEAEGYGVKPAPAPLKFYGFPAAVEDQNLNFLNKLGRAIEEQFHDIFYLGPLRENPRRVYGQEGEEPMDMGQRGELAIPTLMVYEKWGKRISHRQGQVWQPMTEQVAKWLRKLGLIHSFSVQSIGDGDHQYEVWVRQAPNAADVLLPYVGFGVSQILPVLTLCAYVPEGSTLILEHPEMHLHPKAQAGLADVFIDVIKTRNVQIILESHSEHLLHRLQRRIAEEEIHQPESDPQRPESKQIALYFIDNPEGCSEICRLALDPFGSISNWPQDFFGDDLGDLIKMTKAAIRRQKEQE